MDIPPRETPPAAKSEEKWMFSQAMHQYVALSLVLLRCKAYMYFKCQTSCVKLRFETGLHLRHMKPKFILSKTGKLAAL